MLVRLVLALLIIGLLFWLLGKYRRLPESARKKWLIKIGIGTLAAITVLAVITGRMHWLGGVLAALVGFAKFGFTRLLPILRTFGALKNNSRVFGNPVFTTEFLRVQLDLQTNSMTGEVIQGPLKGQQLNQLTNDQLAELASHYQNLDRRSYYLIRVFRQTRNPNSNQQQNQNKQQNYAAVGDPTYDEALQILGLEDYIGQEQPEKKVVNQAYKRLMQKLHPDRGGNDYLASRVNIAKEVVINKISNQE